MVGGNLLIIGGFLKSIMFEQLFIKYQLHGGQIRAQSLFSKGRATGMPP